MAGDTLLPAGWSIPQVLLVLLVTTLVVSVGVAGYTSTTSFSSYNPAWDGARELRATAEATNANAQVILNTTEYASAEPNETIAIILSPDQSYGPSNRQRVRQFVRDGGTLVVAEDFGPEGNALLRAIGAESRFDGRLLRDERHYYRSPAMPVATNVTQSPATDDIEELTLNYGTVIETDASANGTSVLVRSSEFSYIDADRDGELSENETLERRPVVVREDVGNGSVIVVSDPSLFINAMQERSGNQRFVQNLAGAHETVLLDYSHLSGQPPLATFVLWIRDSLLVQALLAIGGVLGIVAWGERWISTATVGRLLRRLDPYSAGSTAEPDPESVIEPDAEELKAYLRAQHPDWDPERVERVMTGVMTDDEQGSDDD